MLVVVRGRFGAEVCVLSLGLCVERRFYGDIALGEALVVGVLDLRGREIDVWLL